MAASMAASMAEAVEIVGHELSAEAVDRRSGIGAHVRARAALGPNVVILTETPFSAVPVDELAAASTICHQCFVGIDPDGPGSDASTCSCCSVCAAAWYCSDECRSRAATFVHTDSSSGAGDAECLTLRRLRGSFDGTRDARLLCRIQRTHCAALSESSRSALVSGSPDQTFADLVYHDAPDDSETVRSAAESVATANRILPASLAIEDEKAGICAILRIRANGFSLLDGCGQPAGVGLFLTAAYFNHSCVPNVCVTNSGDQLVFRTIRPVVMGEELVISYVDAVEQTSLRQEKFRRAYGFECRCLRCTHTVHSRLGTGQMLAAPEAIVSTPSDGGRRLSDFALLRREAERLYTELQCCAEDGALARGVAIATQLSSDQRLTKVLHPHSIAVFAHIAECHRDTLQCSVQP
eukprot:COSAG02_NODE_23_length_52893_cov_58.101868_50_plen_410_part_00